jgi:hypothetical protein
VSRNGNSDSGVRSAAGPAGRRRGEGDGFPRPRRGNIAESPAPPEPEGNLPDCELPLAPRARCATASNPGARHGFPPQAAGAPLPLFPFRGTNRLPGAIFLSPLADTPPLQRAFRNIKS